jgi:hypothetical protein
MVLIGGIRFRCRGIAVAIERSTEKLISSRVEEHKTSQEPNGRTREEGSDGLVTPCHKSPERTLTRCSSPRVGARSRAATWSDLSHGVARDTLI